MAWALGTWYQAAAHRGGEQCPWVNPRYTCTQLESPGPVFSVGLDLGFCLLIAGTLFEMGMSPGLTSPSSPDTYSALGQSDWQAGGGSCGCECCKSGALPGRGTAVSEVAAFTRSQTELQQAGQWEPPLRGHRTREQETASGPYQQ